jgi:hypothetical protein
MRLQERLCCEGLKSPSYAVYKSCGANTKSCCVETPFRPTATLTRSGNDGSSRFPTIFEAGPARAGFAPVNGMTARAELTRGCHTAGTQ